MALRMAGLSSHIAYLWLRLYVGLSGLEVTARVLKHTHHVSWSLVPLVRKDKCVPELRQVL